MVCESVADHRPIRAWMTVAVHSVIATCTVSIGVLLPTARGQTDGSSNPPYKLGRLVEELQETADLTRYLNSSNLLPLLQNQPGPFTLFGPTNAAFSSLPASVRQQLDQEPSAARAVLSYHVLRGQLPSEQFRNDMLVPTLLPGFNVRINVYTNTNVTMVSGRPIILLNYWAINGVLHELSDVMLPPSGSVYDVIREAPGTSKLSQAIQTAAVGDVFQNSDPITMFAPVDEAFDKLPPAVLDNLMKHPDLLKEVLLYHAVNGTFCTGGMSDFQLVTSLDRGRKLVFRTNGRNYFAQGARLIEGDISSTNGVVHLVDTVILPTTLHT